MNVAALQTKGFVRVGPIHVRLQQKKGAIHGLAVWRKGGATMFAGAQLPLRLARRLLLKLCKLANSERPDRRLKARKTLRTILKDIRPIPRLSIVSGVDDDPEVEPQLWHQAEDLIKALGTTEIGRTRLRDIPAKVRERFKKRIHKLAGRIARNRVLSKLRRGYAWGLEGMPGKAAAKAAAAVLAMYGVPPQVSERAIRASMHGQADRARSGGWAGVATRSTDDRGSILKDFAREEFGRHRGGWKDSLSEQFGGRGGGGGGRSSIPFASNDMDRLLGAAEVGGIAEVLDELGEPGDDDLTPYDVEDLELCV